MLPLINLEPFEALLFLRRLVRHNLPLEIANYVWRNSGSVSSLPYCWKMITLIVSLAGFLTNFMLLALLSIIPHVRLISCQLTVFVYLLVPLKLFFGGKTAWWSLSKKVISFRVAMIQTVVKITGLAGLLKSYKVGLE